MLVEMRKVALLILWARSMAPTSRRTWRSCGSPILKAIKYISPGAWVVWPNMPRPGYAEALQTLDDYLYGLIAERRANGGPEDDLRGPPPGRTGRWMTI